MYLTYMVLRSLIYLLIILQHEHTDIKFYLKVGTFFTFNLEAAIFELLELFIADVISIRT